MSRTLVTATRPQQVLQSYLDALLQDAAQELAQADSVDADEFQAAVLEEQRRDAHALTVPIVPAVEQAQPLPLPPEVATAPLPVALLSEAKPAREPRPDPFEATAPALLNDRPSWAQGPFECLLFDVAGLTLAVPLVCLGTIYPLAGQELTHLFGQPDWFLGILPTPAGNLKVLDTARWIMGDRYRADFRQNLQYVISVQGYEWGLAVHQVSRSIRLDPEQIKWRSQRTQRPWLAGTVIEHMCALLDVEALAELIASGATRKAGMLN
jgi:purine-binding chemotaxis protein CheW